MKKSRRQRKGNSSFDPDWLGNRWWSFQTFETFEQEQLAEVKALHPPPVTKTGFVPKVARKSRPLPTMLERKENWDIAMKISGNKV